MDEAAKAIPLLNKMQQLNPESPNLYSLEGNIYERLLDFDNAIRCYKKSIEIDPLFFYGYYQLGAISFNRGVELYDDAANIPIDNDDEYNKMIDKGNDEFEKALVYFEQAYKLTPNDKSTIKALMHIYTELAKRNESHKQLAQKFKDLYESMP